MQAMTAHANPRPRWTLLSLRPRGGHHGLRRAVQQAGGTLLALSPWAIVARTDAHSRHQLQQALQADRLVFTSPAAVLAADALQPLAPAAGRGQWLAVGAGSARALAQVGISGVLSPQQMDSEGLLELPALQQLEGLSVGLVTAPGGRGVIAATLAARGARLQVAHVYERRLLRIAARQRARLRRLPMPCVLALSSGKALQQLWDQLSTAQRAGLLRCQVIAASPRLLQQAHTLGFAGGRCAASAMPADMLQAAIALLADDPGQTCPPPGQA